MSGLYSLPEVDRTRNALRASIIFLVAVASGLPVYIYAGYYDRAWQIFAAAGVSLTLSFIAGGSIWLVRHGRPQLAIKLIFGAMFTAVLIVPFLLAGFGLIGGLAVVLVVTAMATQTLSQMEDLVTRYKLN